MTQPTLIEWDTNNTNILEPDAGHQSDGWAGHEKPTSKNHNWMFQNLYQWRDWLKNRIANSSQLLFVSTNNVSVFLNWNQGTTTLTIPTGGLGVFFPEAAGDLGLNIIPAGSYVIAAGQSLVFILDRTKVQSDNFSMSQVAYGSIGAGKFSIVNNTSLVLANDDTQVILFYYATYNHTGSIFTGLTCPLTGQILRASQSFLIGNSEPRYIFSAGGAATTWTVNHNLGTADHTVQVVDTGGVVLLPDSITLGANTDTISFVVAQDGKAILQT